MTRLAQKAGFRMISLYLDPDGNFPNHHPNPMHEKNREDARQIEIQSGAGGSWPGRVEGDTDGELSTKYPNAGYIGNATISHIFADTVESLGGYYEREMVGHVYIREHMMRDAGIVYAGEHSAHYFFRDNYYMDSGIMAAMVFMAALARK